MELLQVIAFSLGGLVLGYLLPKIGWDLAQTQIRREEPIASQKARAATQNVKSRSQGQSRPHAGAAG